MEKAGRRTVTVMLLGAVVVACSPSGASVHGLDFEPKDAVYIHVDDSAGNDHRNLVVLIADTDDLCTRVNDGASFAGHARLAIRQRWTGSAHFEFMRFDGDCEVEHHTDGGQGWLETDMTNSGKMSASFAFVADGSNVTGDLTARSCRMPEGFMYRCLPSGE